VTSKLAELKNTLEQLLPGSQLQGCVIPDLAGLELQLLAIESESLMLDAQQIGDFWQQLPYWAFAWAAGQGLAQYILANPELVRDKRILDFGSGSGIVGIAAAKAGACSVLCCDSDPLALLACQVNAERNGVQVSVAQQWLAADNKFDCLLAADILYDLTSAGDLAAQSAGIPLWLIAETQYQLPPWSTLSKMDQFRATTLPILDDFDQDLLVSIYQS